MNGVDGEGDGGGDGKGYFVHYTKYSMLSMCVFVCVCINFRWGLYLGEY